MQYQWFSRIFLVFAWLLGPSLRPEGQSNWQRVGTCAAGAATRVLQVFIAATAVSVFVPFCPCREFTPSFPLCISSPPPVLLHVPEKLKWVKMGWA